MGDGERFSTSGLCHSFYVDRVERPARGGPYAVMLLTLAQERPDDALLADARRLVADDPDLAARVLTDLVVIAGGAMDRVAEHGGPSRGEQLRALGLTLLEVEGDKQD